MPNGHFLKECDNVENDWKKKKKKKEKTEHGEIFQFRINQNACSDCKL